MNEERRQVPTEEEIEQVTKERQQPQQTPLEDRNYLLFVNDGESQETIVIEAKTILSALSKFAKEYAHVCSEWVGLNISIEEVEKLK